MKRIKRRWDTEFLQKKRTMQNFAGNARRFEKESLGLGLGGNTQAQKNID